MKYTFVLVLASLSVLPLAAQNQQTPTQPFTMQMQCRDMATTGNYLAPGEVLITGKACHAVAVHAGVNGAAAAAQPAPGTAAPAPSAAAASLEPPPAYAAPAATESDNPYRVYVTDADSWSARGGWGNTPAQSPAAPKDGPVGASAKSPTDDLVTALNHSCPQAIVTSNVDRANFAVTIDHTGKGPIKTKNHVVVFNRAGDDIYSSSTRGLNDSVKDACQAILAAVKK